MAVLDNHLLVWNASTGSVSLDLAGVTDLSRVRVDDLDGDGTVEFVGESGVRATDGSLKWGQDPQGSWKLPVGVVDLDADGLIDPVADDAGCLRVRSGAGIGILWESQGCATRSTAIQPLSQAPVVRGSCRDAGVWQLPGAPYGVQVRVSNSGTASLPSGLGLKIERIQGTAATESWQVNTTRVLRPGEWLDLEITQGRAVTASELRVEWLPRQAGILDRNPANDTARFSEVP